MSVRTLDIEKAAVTRSGKIFDDRGNVWSTSTEDLKHHLASDLPMGALSEQLILQRGYARLHPMEHGVRLELRADRLSEAAYTNVMHWLAENPHIRVSLIMDRGTANEEIIGPPDEIKRQLTTCIQAARSRAAPRLRRLPIPPSTLGSKSPLRSFRLLWEHEIDPDETEFSAVCDRLFQGRYIVTERAGSGDLVIREHGRGYVAYSNAYLSRCVGLRIEDDPDFEYGLWNRDAYQEALRDWRPLIEDVDVTIRGAGEVRRHVRYQRIIAPLADRHGRAFVLSASILASTRQLGPEGT